MTTNASRCERILALIDACLDEVGALFEEQDEPVAVPAGSAHEGGAASS
jgi:hypothetical protein